MPNTVGYTIIFELQMKFCFLKTVLWITRLATTTTTTTTTTTGAFAYMCKFVGPLHPLYMCVLQTRIASLLFLVIGKNRNIEY